MVQKEENQDKVRRKIQLNLRIRRHSWIMEGLKRIEVHANCIKNRLSL
jgi:hypothetical protein